MDRYNHDNETSMEQLKYSGTSTVKAITTRSVEGDGGA